MAFKPLNPVVRAVLVVFGTLMLALGIIGIYVPGLPTTPFLILAAACYMRSSERLFNWMIHHPRFGPPLETFLKEKALSLRIKVFSLVIAWVMLGGLALFVVESTFMKVFLIAVGVTKTVFMLSMKTLSR